MVHLILLFCRNSGDENIKIFIILHLFSIVPEHSRERISSNVDDYIQFQSAEFSESLIWFEIIRKITAYAKAFSSSSPKKITAARQLFEAPKPYYH